MTLGEIVRQYREKNGLSMDIFADRCGLSKGYISMIENNANPRNGKPIVPSLDTIKQISNAMGIGLNSLLEQIDDTQEVAISTKSIPMDNLKRARIYKGLTQEELGKMVNVKKSAVSKYERGDIQPSQEILVAFSKILGVTTDYLLGITNDPYPMPNTDITPERAKELLRKPQDPEKVIINVLGKNGENKSYEMPKKEFDDLQDLRKMLHRKMMEHMDND